MRIKKSLFAGMLMLVFVCSPIKGYADETDLDLEVGIDLDLGNPMPKTPIRPPKVSINDYTLFFNSAHSDYTLTLFDEDGETAYQTIVPAGINVVILPATLSGDFELRLDFGGPYYFYGFISL